MPDVTYVDKFIQEGQKALLSFPRFYDTVLMMDVNDPDHIIRMPLYDVFLRYREHFREAVRLYQMPNSYHYKPKLLSEEIYGTTEMWLPILRLNCMRTIAEFNQSIVKIYEPDIIKELLQIFFKREGKM